MINDAIIAAITEMNVFVTLFIVLLRKINRIINPEVFFKESVLKNFANFT